jgi:hypothetical protein
MSSPHSPLYHPADASLQVSQDNIMQNNAIVLISQSDYAQYPLKRRWYPYLIHRPSKASRHPRLLRELRLAFDAVSVVVTYDRRPLRIVYELFKNGRRESTNRFNERERQTGVSLQLSHAVLYVTSVLHLEQAYQFSPIVYPLEAHNSRPSS